MLSKSRIARHVAGVCLALAGVVAAATPAAAASQATTPVCSTPRADGNYICITLDSASSPTTVTATVYDLPNGRGWDGQVEIDGPTQQLGLSPQTGLPKGGSYTYSVPAVGSGQYCAVDWIWYIYTNSFQMQATVCVTAS